MASIIVTPPVVSEEVIVVLRPKVADATAKSFIAFTVIEALPVGVRRPEG